MPAQGKKRTNLNLLPQGEEDKTLTNRIIHWLLTTFRFLVITVELLVIIGFLSRFFLDSQNSDLSDEINQKKALIASYLPFEKEFKLTQKRIEISRKYTFSETAFSKVLSSVAEKTPEGLQLASIQQKNNSVEINVQGTNEQIIRNFTESLTGSSIISDLHITQIESVANTNQVRATIVGTVNGVEPAAVELNQ